MNKVGIFCHGQIGDAATITSVFRYGKELWGDHKIVWFISLENADILKHQDIEIREFPRGFGYPELTESENRKLIEVGHEPVWRDYKPLVDENNHLKLEFKNQYPELVDLTLGFFPAPHQIEVTAPARAGVEYPECSKKVFGVPMDYEWHPVLKWSDEEKKNAEDFINNAFLKSYSDYEVCLETMAGSGQSIMNDEQVRTTIRVCEDMLGAVNFFFVSHKYLNGNEQFPQDILDKPNVFQCKDFTVRQTALIVERCQLLISVSSGITVASSAWGLDTPTIIQYTGSKICSTRKLARNEFHLIETAGRPEKYSLGEYYDILTQTLNKIKNE